MTEARKASSGLSDDHDIRDAQDSAPELSSATLKDLNERQCLTLCNPADDGRHNLAAPETTTATKVSPEYRGPQDANLSALIIHNQEWRKGPGEWRDDRTHDYWATPHQCS